MSPENQQGLRRTGVSPWSGDASKMLSMKLITMRVWQGNDKKEGHDKPVTLVPPIKAILRILREPVEGRRGKSITSDPGSVSFPEAGWDKDTAAFGHLMDYATKGKINRVHGANVSRNTQRRQIIRARRLLVRDRRSLLDTPIWIVGQRNRIRTQGTTRMCVLSFVYWDFVKPLTVGGWIFNGAQGAIRSIPPIPRFVKESMS